MYTFDIGWYVLYVKRQHENKIDKMLKESNLDTFLPTVKSIRQWADRKKKVERPLFPSYVFINIRSKKEFYKALRPKGVLKYVRFGEEYAKIKNDEINKMKTFLTLEGISEVETDSELPYKGQIMTINYGSLYGQKCEVIRLNNKDKILVRIESMRQNITAIIPSIYLSGY